MPGKFSATRIVRTKTSPTTQVTTGELDWELAVRSQAVSTEQTDVKESSSNATSSETGSSSRGGGATRSHGLLTPHASISENLVEQEYASARSSPPSTSSGHISEIRFATPAGSSSLTNALDSPVTPRSQAFGSNTGSLSSGLVSYASVGVQTSLPYSSSSNYYTTSPTSLVTPKTSPKRKRVGTPEYVREGERLARELDEDFAWFAGEKRRLKRELARIERKERELQSFLIPSPALTDDAEKIETDGEATDIESDSAQRMHFRGRTPLTPASSDHENLPKPPENMSKAPTLILPTIPPSSGHTSTSESIYVSTNSGPSKSSIDHDNGSITSSTTSSALKAPNYTFAEGSSTGSSVTSPRDESRGIYDEDLGLAPNPVRDPSMYLVWFDLETTDAVRPAANIRILEVAALITDKNYQPLDKGKSFIVHWPLSAEEIANEMSERVREMHETSGLLAAYASTPAKDRLTLAQVERRICKYLEWHDIGPNGRAVMAGAGVAFDRGMVRQHMEKLNRYFSHQIFDTTTLWHVIRRKYGRTKRFSDKCNHRTLDDILGSSREARLYSELVFKPPREVNWPTQSSQGI